MQKPRREKKSIQAIDLVTPVKGYEGKWVVLSSDNKKVLVSAYTLPALIKKGKRLGITKGTAMSVGQKQYQHFVGI